jgi:hypothetical protein
MLRVRASDGNEERVSFGSCLFDALCLADDVYSHPSVVLHQAGEDGDEDEDNELGLRVTLSLGNTEGGGVPLGHAHDCPARQAKNMPAVPVQSSTDVRDRDRGRKPRVQIGVVVLIEANDPGSIPYGLFVS